MNALNLPGGNAAPAVSKTTDIGTWLPLITQSGDFATAVTDAYGTFAPDCDEEAALAEYRGAIDVALRGIAGEGAVLELVGESFQLTVYASHSDAATELLDERRRTISSDEIRAAVEMVDLWEIIQRHEHI